MRSPRRGANCSRDCSRNQVPIAVPAARLLNRRVAKGDVILVPAGTPHWYRDLEGSLTYLEVRFDLPK